MGKHSLYTAPAGDAAVAPPATGVSLQLDDYDLVAFARLAARFGGERYGYAVTPNVDHLVRLHEDAAFRELYADADFVLLTAASSRACCACRGAWTCRSARAVTWSRACSRT